jgi:hypothetical protein
VKNDYGTEKEAWALNGLEEPLKTKYITAPEPISTAYFINSSHQSVYSS